ncbi:acetyl-coenzyme A synthetase 2-like, mitochondrial, partial [Carassius auratus]|uniref:Acetyl-coenzyme A synthetase 2-like, mitochondrial n=1 Tax=Carassius auratus TaxID=7957 RepID=A0A6P6MSU1_CARAU
DEHPDVPETAVIGVPHEIKGEGKTPDKPQFVFHLSFFTLEPSGTRQQPETFRPLPFPFAFVVLKESATDNQRVVVEDLRHLVATKIAKYAVPDHFLVVKRLPKTRSGKIMRRILRKVAMQDTSNLGDVSTLDDPSVVSEIIEAHKHYRSRAAKK